MKVGLVLLTGGRGTRMGTLKHDLAHPSGHTWGGWLVAVFRAVFPDGPVQVVGEALRGWGDLPVLADPRQGPAVALRHWAAAPAPEADLWWLLACDQVRWTEADLRTWVASAQAADPGLEAWVLGRRGGQLQTLGSLLPHRLRPALAQTEGGSLRELVAALPHRILPTELAGWWDLDSREDRALYNSEWEGC